TACRRTLRASVLPEPSVAQNRCPTQPCCFCFQAEDRIRGAAVTGVQTCALRISLQDWPVCLKDAYPGYIGWEEFMANQRRLARRSEERRVGKERWSREWATQKNRK